MKLTAAVRAEATKAAALAFSAREAWADISCSRRQDAFQQHTAKSKPCLLSVLSRPVVLRRAGDGRESLTEPQLTLPCGSTDKPFRARRKKQGGDTGKHFTEGWVEFEDKREAKRVRCPPVNFLNRLYNSVSSSQRRLLSDSERPKNMFGIAGCRAAQQQPHRWQAALGLPL